MFRARKTTKRVSAEKVKPVRPVGHDEDAVSNPMEKLLLAVVFSVAVLLLILHRPMQEGGWGAVAGGITLVLTLHYLFGSYLLRFQREVFRNLRRFAAVLILVLLILVLARLTLVVEWWSPLLVPVSLAAVILSIVFNQRFAVEATGFILLYTGAILYGYEDLLRVMVTLFAGAMAGILATTGIRKRSKLVSVGISIGVVHVVVLASLSLFLGETYSMRDVILDLVTGFVHGAIVGFVLTGLLPVIEYALETVTEISLLELSNQNEQPLLRKLLIEAPGTHHHSFVLGIMAESAAETIGANALLCRVGAYFHDIGKMNKPEYFIENSADAPVKHSMLNPEMSKLIITAHTKDGIDLADYYGLPQAIKNFITEHHGTSAVEYFYQEALARSDDDTKVTRDTFRYPGPRPRSKETAIVMLADSVEAALRSIDDPSMPRLRAMVHEVVMKKLTDGQLDDCLLTLRELHRLEEAFFQVAVGIFHKRPIIPNHKPPKAEGDARSGEAAEDAT
jgi:putative nucleotidyltransferase with HDIG domain